MIKAVQRSDLAACTGVIRQSFATVAEEFGFTEENAPRFTAFAVTEERLAWQLERERRPMFAYWEAGCIAGYYSLWLQENGDCELHNLCVRIGIVKENTRLRAWYEGFGFVHTGTR